MTKKASLISIRFAFLFWILFVLCFNNGAFPFLYYIQPLTVSALHAIVPLFAAKFLGLAEPITIFTNGSGDTTYSYVLLLFIFILAVFTTLIWSALDRKRKSHKQLFYWLTVVLRFYVGFMLVHYGIAKLNNGQFPELSSARLLSTYGESSPMGLAWSFLSYSNGYKWFMCFAELMGILLFFRRTATIGAFLCLMTCANIMAINYFFDVPVKILSTALVLMCLTILSPNILRLFRFFVLGKMVQLNLLKPPVFKAKWIRISKLVVKYAAIILYFGVPLFMALKTTWFKEKSNDKSAIQRCYNVDEVNWVNSDSSNLSLPWKVLAFEGSNYGLAQLEHDEINWLKYNFNSKSKVLEFYFTDNTKLKYTFNYSVPSEENMILKGNVQGKPVIITLRKKRFELTEREFNWISEHPYNR